MTCISRKYAAFKPEAKVALWLCCGMPGNQQLLRVVVVVTVVIQAGISSAFILGDISGTL